MDPVAELLLTYEELNGSAITELDAEPSALEYMRFVALNTPFVVRGAASEWKATKLWNRTYLEDVMGNQVVNVAVTPKGNADSAVPIEGGKLLFVKPLEECQPFKDLLDYLIAQEMELVPSGEEIRYAQTQNDNLRGEYAPLLGDVEKDISWARIALQKQPEAINLWLGNSRSVTALHKDNYENIYCQLIGRKHFVLLPPLSSPCVRELDLTAASYVRENGELKIAPDQGSPVIPFPTWDPDVPDKAPTKYSRLARPVRVTLEAGDMLYLPALWYHKVSQSCSSEGVSCSVNYWYDLFSYAGSFLPYIEFVRNVSKAL